MANNVEIEMDALKKRLQKMRDNLSNPSPTMQKVSILMHKDVMNHFGKEEGDTGSWTPLKYRKGKALQDTGRLRNSIKPDNTKDTAIVGTNVIYAGVHNFGYKSIPQRKFLWLSKEIQSQITNILGKYFIAE